MYTITLLAYDVSIMNW